MKTNEDYLYTDIMLDIETMDSESYGCIVSIGAIKFNMSNGSIGERFYEIVDLQSCLDAGLTISAKTLKWWLKQDEKARLELANSEGIALDIALYKFAQFCNYDYNIWARSPRFDCGLLQNAYNRLGMKIPWDFRKEKCVRTLEGFNPKIKDEFKNENLHNALSDCLYQIQYCVVINNSITVL